MDVKIGDWVLTPRYGKPVEIQALWYDAPRAMANLAARFGDPSCQKRYAEMEVMARSSFNRLFWQENAGCLYGVVDAGPPDASIRPNQIFSVSLRHSMFSLERARSVVDVAAREC